MPQVHPAHPVNGTGPGTGTGTPVSEVASAASAAIDAKKLEEEKRKMQLELQIRDDIIHELEMRLAEVPEANGQQQQQTPTAPKAPSQIEMETLNAQLAALQTSLGGKDSQLEALQGRLSKAEEQRLSEAAEAKRQLEELRAEQEDLLVLLSDQDSKTREYRQRLRALGQEVEEEEEE